MQKTYGVRGVLGASVCRQWELSIIDHTFGGDAFKVSPKKDTKRATIVTGNKAQFGLTV